VYHQVIAQCARQLDHLLAILDRAETFAAAEGIAPEALLAERLAPDMYPLMAQIQAACDYAKGGAAHLSGQTPPRHPDDEQTFAEARARVRKTLDYMRGVAPAAFADAAERTIQLPWKAAPVAAEAYALQVVLANVYFHTGIAYAILRKRGVNIGKADFLGEIYRRDA